MKNVLFKAINGTGEDGYQVFVDKELVVACIDDLDIGSRTLEPLWEKLGVTLGFES